MRGLSPFNAEKTPSFYVNDQKGFYHCFSSGKHGDVFRFLMETEGLTFPEAVERLAAEAGVALPEVTRRGQQREEERASLYEVLELAAHFFEGRLHARDGAARPRLSRRSRPDAGHPGRVPPRLRARRALRPARPPRRQGRRPRRR